MMCAAQGRRGRALYIDGPRESDTTRILQAQCHRFKSMVSAKLHTGTLAERIAAAKSAFELHQHSTWPLEAAWIRLQAI